ncbi:hypothetical protein HYH03_017818 [Edaphochlamys debaryana]|uniref:Uncharacterized protein n=1 Tax=Edaphochlamys debaryana TaxID=47281 RepID=A0A835XF00_9CHLO|nr:hypothetical protein HYH03_017818 [Edaphochlamys debaryana]|eukprot:KAG2483317.1 hypothetical protein HYH03_017818 [Edaphochlamys debaryana]
MGCVRITCEAGCKCPPYQINALTERRASVTNITDIAVSQHKACVLQFTTLGPGLPVTAGAGNKFKLIGIVVGAGAKAMRYFGPADDPERLAAASATGR